MTECKAGTYQGEIIVEPVKAYQLACIGSCRLLFRACLTQEGSPRGPE